MVKLTGIEQDSELKQCYSLFLAKLNEKVFKGRLSEEQQI